MVGRMAITPFMRDIPVATAHGGARWYPCTVSKALTVTLVARVVEATV
jgi:hypothetical protein